MNKYVKVIGIIFIILFFIPTSILAEEQENNQVLSIEELEDVKKPGTYLIRLKAEVENNSGVDKFIRITITNPKTKINENSREGIDANDFRISEKSISTLTAEDFIKLSQAYAWSLDTGKQVPITDVKVVASDNFKSDYLITFSTEKHTEITVKMFLRDRVLDYDSLAVNMSEIKKATPKQLSIIIFSIILMPIFGMLFLYFYFKQKIKKSEEVLYK